jgi:exosortase E/protease (VPEID-CTERM system)
MLDDFSIPLNEPQLGLGRRLGIVAIVLTIEAVLHTVLFQSVESAATSGFGEILHEVQHLLFRFLVAYGVFCAILIGLNRRESLSVVVASHAHAPVRLSWCALHVVLVVMLGALSFGLHTSAGDMPYLALGVAWLLCAIGAVATLCAGLAPMRVWTRAARNHRAELLYAIAPAIATIVAIYLSRSLWGPAARVTFSLVAMMLNPVVPYLYTNLATMTLGTNRFVVMIADVCSGIEGVGLMLVFSVSWLWFFRREYYLPRALIIVPVALLLMFLLNSVRIAALVLIGDAGYPNIAIVGFHSQAGWIAFNAVALGVAIVSRRSAWLNRSARDRGQSARTQNPTAPYLVPLLAILAAGMIAHALSAGFDFFYPLRLAGGLAALWVYRHRYPQSNWRFSWRAVAVGTLVFAVWVLFDRLFNVPHAMPDALAQASGAVRGMWIVCRALAAIVTVSIAEELAYRGYLMRVFASRDFDAVALRDVRWPALALASIVFGATHGFMWLPGIIAGVAYGLLSIRSNTLGEAVAAHATTNALVAAAVLIFDQWQLW